MKLFVTGLCLQGNKGGPALVFSLLRALRDKWPDLEFVLSVPRGGEYKHEEIASRKYGIEIVGRSTAWDLLPPTPKRLKRFLAWLSMLRKCDFVLEMSAISYVGPPAGNGTFQRVFLGYRFFYFAVCRVIGKPFVAWTQSYGPFSTTALRIAGRMDLRRQPTVLCRGDDCASLVRELIPGKSTRSFPDVAVVLNCEKSASPIPVHALGTGDTRLATISPSAVIYSKVDGSEKGNAHVRQISSVIDFLQARKFDVLLVPHTFRPERHDPRICDYAVCKLVQALNTNSVQVVEEDFSPQELKGVISSAYLHVGARYHSIVAALSTAVPCISLSWHEKYLDIMRFYGMGEFVFDSVSTNEESKLHGMIDSICSRRCELADMMRQQQSVAVKLVEENVGVFVDNFERIANR